MLLNLFAHMGKSIWVNPLLGDGATFSFGGAQTQEGQTSNTGTADAEPEEVKTGFCLSASLAKQAKNQKERCLRRGHRGKRT